MNDYFTLMKLSAFVMINLLRKTINCTYYQKDLLNPKYKEKQVVLPIIAE
jgi:hypothetical protein